MQPKRSLTKAKGSTVPEYGFLLAFSFIALFMVFVFFGGSISEALEAFGTGLFNLVSNTQPGSAGSYNTGL